MDMARVWPIVCQYGVGAVLSAVGIWCGIRSGYLDLANAEDRRAANLNKLMVVEARVDEGPMFKRMQPHSRGMAWIIKRRTSHIRVALE